MKAQTTCPVMGRKINKTIFADHDGKRVYFCCGMCPGAFKKAPAKYIKKLEDRGVKVESSPANEGAHKDGTGEKEHAKTKPQTTCPVMGGGINKRIFADHDGKRVYFCCGGCIGAFKKSPAKYIKKLEDEGVKVERVSAAGKAGGASSGNGGCGGC